jgi:hypothetical protein
VTKLLAVLVWPAILAFILIRFRAALGDFMTSLSEFDLPPENWATSVESPPGYDARQEDDDRCEGSDSPRSRSSRS